MTWWDSRGELAQLLPDEGVPDSSTRVEVARVVVVVVVGVVVVVVVVSSCLNMSSWSTGGDGRPLVGQDVVEER